MVRPGRINAHTFYICTRIRVCAHARAHVYVKYRELSVLDVPNSFFELGATVKMVPTVFPITARRSPGRWPKTGLLSSEQSIGNGLITVMFHRFSAFFLCTTAIFSSITGLCHSQVLALK